MRNYDIELPVLDTVASIHMMCSITVCDTGLYANTFGAHQTETRHRVDDSLSRLACRHTAH